MSRELPRYINILSICKALGPEWRAERVTRILRNMGIVKKLSRSGTSGKGSYNFVTPEDLAGAWPDCYEEILSKLAELEPYLRKQPRFRAKTSKRRSVSKRTRVKIDTTTSPTYDYDSNTCSYEVGGVWACAPECDNPDHKR